MDGVYRHGGAVRQTSSFLLLSFRYGFARIVREPAFEVCVSADSLKTDADCPETDADRAGKRAGWPQVHGLMRMNRTKAVKDGKEFICGSVLRICGWNRQEAIIPLWQAMPA